MLYNLEDNEYYKITRANEVFFLNTIEKPAGEIIYHETIETLAGLRENYHQLYVLGGVLHVAIGFDQY